MKNLVKLLKWVWQFPQNIVGFVLSRNYYYKSVRQRNGKWIDFYFKSLRFCRGVCFGDFIIIDKWFMGKSLARALFTDLYKYHILSLILGWLYLPLVGVYMIFSNKKVVV